MKAQPNTIDQSAIQLFARSIYQAKEALYGGSLRWKWGGMDYAAYEATRETEEVIAELTEVLKQDAVQTARGFLAGETAVRHAQLQDSVRRGQMMRGAETFAGFLETLVRSLEATGLPEELIIDVVEGISKLAMERALESPSPPPSDSRRTSEDHRPIIIDPDEF